MRATLPALVLSAACQPPQAPTARPEAPVTRISVRVRDGLASGPLQGRLLVLLAAGEHEDEPRFLVGDGDETAQVFGIDLDGWDGSSRVLAGDVAGYPLDSPDELPAGEVRAQAVLHRYETFTRADGHVVSLPPDRGEGQQWNRAPGNLVSTPVKVRLERGGAIELELDQVIPPLPPFVETRLLKRIEIESKLLTKFWGRSMKLGALVLLPEGWESHPSARYPVVINHGHFSRTLSGYREEPPDPSLPAVNLEGLRLECPDGHSDACGKHGYERYMQEAAHGFFKQWTGPSFPRVLLVQIEHANPYYDDSYAVNSENLGPYGDAITHELIPAIEERFRGLGPWARGMYGGSTGGWEALAAQVLYPDAYNGAIACCPDPLDFRAYGNIDLYQDTNAYYSEGPFRRTPRAGSRTPDGRLRSTIEQDNRMELALGTRSRSGQQWDIWEAVYSPVGPDGYPRRVFDKRTGVIDRSVLEHWRERYDLGHILTRDWATLGPKLRGKLWIHVGDMDTFFLERSVRLVEERLRALGADAVVTYGHGHGHCWSGVPEQMNFESRMTYHARFIPLLVERFLQSAPQGADTKSWRY